MQIWQMVRPGCQLLVLHLEKGLVQDGQLVLQEFLLHVMVVLEGDQGCTRVHRVEEGVVDLLVLVVLPLELLPVHGFLETQHFLRVDQRGRDIVIDLRLDLLEGVPLEVPGQRNCRCSLTGVMSRKTS